MPDLMPDFLFDLPDVRDRDFTEHNEATVALWKAFEERRHERVPVRLNNHPRMLMLDPFYNARGITYETYMHDWETMAQAQLEWQYWKRFLLPGDHEKGLPETWQLYVDFENHYDAAWFGCPIRYFDGQVPDADPILADDTKRKLFDQGIPDPFAGEWFERALEYIERMREKCEAGWEFLGRPIAPPEHVPFLGTDGIFTAAVALRGPTELCTDMMLDPEYVHELMDYVCTACIERIAAWREKRGVPVGPQDGFGSADDSILLLSVDQMREFVLPYLRRLYDAFGTETGRSIHLCGDAQRHFPVLKKELGISSFDTGFPIDFARLREELGPDVLVSGGPQISLFLEEDPNLIVEETKRILASGILKGGRFILQEGNNLPPFARLDVCEAFYETGKRFGKVDECAAEACCS
jgi:uroporphyrinogen-III decarboxylase